MSKEFRKLKLAELNRLSVEEFQNEEKLPIIAVLDNIRSLNNIGSIFRTADAFRINSVWLTGYTAQPPHREIQKTALGSTETVSWKHYQSPVEAIKALKEMGYTIVAIEQSTNSIAPVNFNPNGMKVAIVLGNEVEGVSDDYMKVVDEVIEIPQEGTKHSLNVTVAAGIVLHTLFEKMK